MGYRTEKTIIREDMLTQEEIRALLSGTTYPSTRNTQDIICRDLSRSMSITNRYPSENAGMGPQNERFKG